MLRRVLRVQRVPRVAIVAFAALALLVIVASRVVVFVHIFQRHSGEALTQEQVEAAYNNGAHSTQFVPKIIHQIFHNWKDPNNETLPSDWEAVRKTCMALNPDWEYKVRPPTETTPVLRLVLHCRSQQKKRLLTHGPLPRCSSGPRNPP
jgi:inositol phosphorylceramide mannosyltransferase catalytic subunit